ncbi:MAG: hypothetical protein COV66_07800 [Nitrospinae bacterium CG11_big_fil_rev_8_21_14_0_20_45_15]|nr:MAG: hypothetical protein COV66_07800 [Nitrospinae bacterium CG11_big_fil_rev_8_21_14_0_20_45_15]
MTGREVDSFAHTPAGQRDAGPKINQQAFLATCFSLKLSLDSSIAPGGSPGLPAGAGSIWGTLILKERSVG